MTVVRVDPLTDPRWDSFVQSQPRAHVYHLAAWARILGSAYRQRPVYLALLDGAGNFEGVLPLMYRNGLLSDPALRSLPVVPSGGPLAHSREQEIALLRAACETREPRARLLTVQSNETGYEHHLPNLRVDSLMPFWALELPSDPEVLRARWKKRSGNFFRDVKKAEAADLSFRQARSERDLKRFYRLYLKTMRKHRAIPRTYRQLALARELLEPSGVFRLFLVEKEGELLAGAVFHTFKGTVELLYNGSDDRHLKLRPNHALYWGVIRWAIEQGYTEFNFGRAWPDDSLGWFKARWGAEQVPNFRYVHLFGKAATRTDTLVAASNRMQKARQGLFERAWNKVPTPLTRLAGHIIYKYL